MGRQAITVERVLDAVVRDMGWEIPSSGEKELTYIDFQNIMVFSGISMNLRKCRELWSMLSVMRIPSTGQSLVRSSGSQDVLIVSLQVLGDILSRKSKPGTVPRCGTSRQTTGGCPDDTGGAVRPRIDRGADRR